MSQVVAPTGGSAAERRRRIITGQKTFASDYRPVDLGWPEQYAHALLLRASVADRTFASVDLGRIRPELRPDVLVTATDLAPAFRNYITKQQVELLVTPGQPVDYVGQPVALLLYNDFIRFRRAAQELREDAGPVVYGSPVAAATFTTIEQELEAWRELRCENPQGESHFLFDLSADQSQWTRGKLTRTEEGFCRKGLRDPDSDANSRP